MANNLENKQLYLSKIITKKTWVRLLSIWFIVFLFTYFSDFFSNATTHIFGAISIFILLLITIIAASFGVVKEADELAHKLGEPYGTLILTLSVVSIEVILISAVLLGPGENPTIGKDSIFSVMMIIMNLVIGLCLLLGGLKFGEQEYNAQGAMSYFGMIVLLGSIGLLLPNYVVGAGEGILSTFQAIIFSVLIIFLYGAFLWFQIKRYNYLYIQPKIGFMETRYTAKKTNLDSIQDTAGVNTPNKIKSEIWIRSLLLILMILPIVLLSHHLAVVVDYGIKIANLPPLLGGIIIAIIVFTPESITAVKAALNNEFQRVLNLCHGAFVSTVGLTIPSVLLVGLFSEKLVLFGISALETILFLTTLLLSLITFIGKRTTPIFGIMHLALFVIFIVLVFNP